MAERIPQSTTLRVPFKAVYANTDGAPGLSFNIKCSKNGGLFANIATANSDAVEVASGWYYIPAGVAETGVQGPLIFLAHNPTNTVKDVEIVYDVQDADLFRTMGETANAVWAEIAYPVTGQSYGELMKDMDEEIDLISAEILAIGTAAATTTSVIALGDNTTAPLVGPAANIAFLGFPTGTYTDTHRADGLLHTITADNGGLEIVYKFRLPAGASPVNASWRGYFNPLGAIGSLLIWNFITNLWETIPVPAGTETQSEIVLNFSLFPEHIGQEGTAEFGNAYGRFRAIGQPGAVLATDQIYVTYQQNSQSVGYTEGAVWIDTVSGATGTNEFFNGTADKPCFTFADAYTIARSVGLRRFRIFNGSNIVLTEEVPNYSFVGKNWKFDPNGHDIRGCYFEGAIANGAAQVDTPDPLQFDKTVFTDCTILDLTLGNVLFERCLLFANVTTLPDAQYTTHLCSDGTPLTTQNPRFVFAANAQVGARMWSGGMALANLHSGNYLTIDGGGRVIIENTCVGGNITIRGPISTTDSVTGGFQGTLTVTNRLGDTQKVSTVTGALGAPAVASIWAQIVEGSTTALQALRGLIASQWGKLTGAPNGPIAIRDTSDTKDRIVATVDAYGNRISITKDLS